MKRYKIITYGCQMNVHESEKLEGMLSATGYFEAADIQSADLIIFNTCCIRGGAEDKTFSNIGALKKYKEKNPALKIAVCGCMPQKKDTLERLKTRFPYVDIIFGTHNLHTFQDLLIKSEVGGRVVEVWEKEGGIEEGKPYSRRGATGWVNIMYGCNNFCAYCIVPYVRGRERSRAAEDVIKEVTELAAAGTFTEICLLGQNVNSYAGTYAGEPVNFEGLLKLLCAVPGDFKISFMTSHPKDLSDGVIDLIADCEKLKKSIHLPVQSGSDRILSAMNRKYSAAYYTGLADKIREKVKGAVLTSDIIVGFPGETDEDYDMTLQLIKRVRFNNLYMFMFSAREGTPAFSLPGQIPLDIKRGRLIKLISLQRKIQKEIEADIKDKTI